MDKELIDRLAVASVEKPSKDWFIGTEPHMGLYLDIGEYAIPIGDLMYRFAALLAEECAKACESETLDYSGENRIAGRAWDTATEYCAHAIREKFSLKGAPGAC